MLTKSEIDSLSIEECAELAILLWDKAYSFSMEKPLTDEQKKELDRRLEYDEQHPGNTVPWEEFMSKYST